MPAEMVLGSSAPKVIKRAFLTDRVYLLGSGDRGALRKTVQAGIEHTLAKGQRGVFSSPRITQLEVAEVQRTFSPFLQFDPQELAGMSTSRAANFLSTAFEEASPSLARVAFMFQERGRLGASKLRWVTAENLVGALSGLEEELEGKLERRMEQLSLVLPYRIEKWMERNLGLSLGMRKLAGVGLISLMSAIGGAAGSTVAYFNGYYEGLPLGGVLWGGTGIILAVSLFGAYAIGKAVHATVCTVRVGRTHSLLAGARALKKTVKEELFVALAETREVDPGIVDA